MFQDNSRKFMSNVKFYKCQLILFKIETFIVFCGHVRVSNYFKLKCLTINPEVSFDNSTPILRTLKLILFFPLPTVLRGWLVAPWQHLISHDSPSTLKGSFTCKYVFAISLQVKKKYFCNGKA
jgi:hypothetical protein